MIAIIQMTFIPMMQHIRYDNGYICMQYEIILYLFILCIDLNLLYLLIEWIDFDDMGMD